MWETINTAAMKSWPSSMTSSSPGKGFSFAGRPISSGPLVERFAGYHRQSYGGCKVGVGDVLIGAASLAADFNGAAKASHIIDKIIEMVHLNETLYSCGLACSSEGHATTGRELTRSTCSWPTCANRM